MTADDASRVLAGEAEVTAAIERLASEITARLARKRAVRRRC